MTEKADILFDPTFSPVDNASREIVLGIAEELNLTLTSKKSEKVVVILSSLLWACQKIRRDGGKANLIGWSHDDSYWVEYPAVGKRVVNEVRQALVDNGWLTLHTPAAFKSTMTVYQIDESVFTHEGRWVQSEKPTIIVKSAKTKFRSSGSTIGGEKMTPTKAKKEFGSKYSEQQSRLDKLKEYWKIHPLIIDDDRYCSATRIFNDNKMDRGGRLYGGWTTLPEATRLTGTIDGEPVAEIDLRGANLTLLTGMTDNKMPMSPFGDPYSFVDADREMVKKATLELLGSGNAKKRSGSKEFNDQFGKGQFPTVRDKLTAAYPALKELEPQVLDSNTLAFRESEIILATIETLKTKEIVSYPMHDAVICKASEAGQVAEKLQQEFERNCGIRPALTIQTLSEEKEFWGAIPLGST